MLYVCSITKTKHKFVSKTCLKDLMENVTNQLDLDNQHKNLEPV